MAKKPLVHCRRCHVEIDRDNQTDWVMPSKGWYYHNSCYEDFVKKREISEKAISALRLMMICGSPQCTIICAATSRCPSTM